MSFFLTFALLCIFSKVTSEFNKHFASFVENNYGEAFLDALQRSDLGDSGSFGGKINENDPINNDPVIFVHGVSDFAGGKMQALAASYQKNGYSRGELYATSYDLGPRNNPFSWAEYSLKCEHVKQIRTLILAVRYYTLRDVDVIAYSFGVPLARKAIMGGVCVDTKEDLGPSLTLYVDTFVGVAGPNHGISLQVFQFLLARIGPCLQVAGMTVPGCVIGAIPIFPICSKVIGLYSGFCPIESSFLMDINQQNHYEGRFVFSLYTETDSWIGYKICDQITARIPGEDGHKLFKKFSHEDVILRTSDVQMQMIQMHSSQDNAEVKKINRKSFQLNHRSKYSIASDFLHQQNLHFDNLINLEKPSSLLGKNASFVLPSQVKHDFHRKIPTQVHENSRNSSYENLFKNTHVVSYVTSTAPESTSSLSQKNEGFHTHVNVSIF